MTAVSYMATFCNPHHHRRGNVQQWIDSFSATTTYQAANPGPSSRICDSSPRDVVAALLSNGERETLSRNATSHGCRARLLTSTLSLSPTLTVDTEKHPPRRVSTLLTHWRTP
jgi:hypothetical protein